MVHQVTIKNKRFFLIENYFLLNPDQFFSRIRTGNFFYGFEALLTIIFLFFRLKYLFKISRTVEEKIA